MSQYKSLLGLNEFSVDSLNIANLDLTNTNIIGLNTDRVPEDAVPINLYFTDGRFDTRLATKSTTDIKEGTNLYYTDGRFDTRFSTKSTTNLTEGLNYYWTDNRFDTRLALKSTADVKEGTNLYYTDGRFDTRLATKSTTNLTEGLNLYYTTARANTDFDARLLLKTTADLKEGTNLYYTTARANTDFDTRLATKSIDALSDCLITTPADNQLLIYSTGQWRNVASPFLRLDGTASMTGGLNMGGFAITNVGNVDGIDVSTLDTSVVKLTGDQTIAGNKKFTSTIEVRGATAPTAFDGIGVAFDTATNIGMISAQKIATAAYYPIQITGSYVELYSGNNVIATATGTTLSLNNNKITNLATPTATTDGANKSYVDTLDGQNVKLTGNQTIAGTKTFSNEIKANAGVSTTALTTSDNIVVGAGKKIFLDRSGYLNTNNKLVLYDGGGESTTVFYGFGIASGILIYNVDSAGASHVFYYGGSNELFRINNTAITASKAITANAGISTTTLTASGAITANGGLNMGGQSITNVNLVDGIDVSTLDTSVVKLTGNQTIAGIKTFSSALEITGNSTNATTKGTFVVFNSTANIGTIGCLDMGTGVNYNFEINAKKVSFVIDGAIVGWVNASGLDCNSSKIANLGTPTLAADGANKSYVDTLDGQNVKITGNQTIAGTKTFNNQISMGTNLIPTLADHVANKKYVDDNCVKLTGDQTIAGTKTFSNAITASDKITTALGKPIIIGKATKGVGATGGLEIYGTMGDAAGAHFQTITTEDAYPTFQLFNWAHNDINLCFDAYFDGTNFKSSHSGSNFLIQKANKLAFYYKTGITAGSNIASWTEAMNISTAGLLTANAGISTTTLTASGLITANAGITYTGTLTTTAGLNGSKLSIQGGTDGGNTRGIFLWETGNSAWGIYMGQSGANKALSGTGTAPSANGITTHAVRFRSGAAATEGFIWENGSDFALMSVRGSDGYLWCRSGITSSDTITINNSASQLYFSDGTTTTCGIRWLDDNHGIFCKRNSDQMYFREYGTCYFQTTGANTRATLTSSGIVNTSDRRHKTDIRDAKFCGLDFINALKPKCFKLKESKRENCGFIAQDIEELVEKKLICFNPVEDHKMSKDDGTTEELKTMNYFDLIAPIVKATQELSEKVNNLEKENKILLNILQDQTNQLAEIRAVLFPSNAP